MDFTIAIPVFNEQKAIGQTLHDLLEHFPPEKVLVVDDGSSDESGRIARNCGVRVITHAHNHGYGASIKTAVRKCGTEYVAFFDADGQHDPTDLKRMLEEAQGQDAVIGMRTRRSHTPLLRIPGKLILHFVANFLSPQSIPDINCGLRVFRRATLARYLHLLPDGFSASTTSTMLAVNRGLSYRFSEVTVGKRTGKSTVRQIPAGFATIHLIIRMIVLFNPLKFFFPLSLMLFVGGLAYGIAVALLNHQGIPVASMLFIMASLFTFFFGLISDQISELQKSRFEEPS